jgi:hypothetical protein
MERGQVIDSRCDFSHAALHIFILIGEIERSRVQTWRCYYYLNFAGPVILLPLAGFVKFCPSQCLLLYIGSLATK